MCILLVLEHRIYFQPTYSRHHPFCVLQMHRTLTANFRTRYPWKPSWCILTRYHQAILSWDARPSKPFLGILPQILPVFAVSQYFFSVLPLKITWQNYGNMLFLTTWCSHHTFFSTGFSDGWYHIKKCRCFVHVRNKWHGIFTDPHVATSISIELSDRRF